MGKVFSSLCASLLALNYWQMSFWSSEWCWSWKYIWFNTPLREVTASAYYSLLYSSWQPATELSQCHLESLVTPLSLQQFSNGISIMKMLCKNSSAPFIRDICADGFGGGLKLAKFLKPPKTHSKLTHTLIENCRMKKKLKSCLTVLYAAENVDWNKVVERNKFLNTKILVFSKANMK